jgi:phosphoribosyl 1,2-cyclic phosphodiesterase/CheY-like chemotaxis protein
MAKRVLMKRVLIIDDDAITRAFIRRVLQKEGYELREMESADRLEEALPELAPDLILCDVMMPGRDGMEVCRELRSNQATRTIAVVLISAKNFEADRRAALDAGAAGYLVKPIDAAELVRVVEGALSTQACVRIWGCRGSIPSPEHALGLYGGNTSCIEVVLPGQPNLIFDAGTGIRALGNCVMGDAPLRMSLFLTHFHWDHIQGLPFFKPFYVPGNEFRIYGPAPSNDALTETLAGQMGSVFFPVSMDAFRASLKFHALQEQTLQTPGASISTLYALHPGRTLAYRVDAGERSLVYAPDNELLPECAEAELAGEALRLAQFASGASLLIHDCQYSREQYEKRRGWGHSSAETLAAVAAGAGVKRVLLFHHDPDHTDEEVQAIHREFERGLAARGAEIPSEPAREGEAVFL